MAENLYRDFDEAGQEARIKKNAQRDLRAHENRVVLHKLREGKPLTPSDRAKLQKMLLDAGVGESGDIDRAC